MNDREIKVTFTPERNSVFVLPGTSVIEAAGRAGIIINSPCGGAGKCGKCRVQVVEGDVRSKVARAEFGLREDERLSCQTELLSDSVIYVPPESRRSSQRILVNTYGEGEKEIKPSLQKVYIELDRAQIQVSGSELGSIRRKLGGFDAKIYIIRKLPGILRQSDYKVTCVLSDNELISIESGDTTGICFGLAFDIGTTTIAGSLIDINTGRDISVTSRMNPQSSYGDDVISRIGLVMKDRANLEKLQSLTVRVLSGMIDELVGMASVKRENIYKIVVAGNTTMQHLLCKISPEGLGVIPFVPPVRESLRIKAKKIGLDINADGSVYVFPNIGGFVGGDTVSAILSGGIYKSEEIKLMIDIGTNGEIALGNRQRLLAASTAAGPAFEGARISCGMGASEGAIEKVVIDGDVQVNVIGGVSPRGLCGSGLIDAVAQLLQCGVIDETGRVLPRNELREKMSPGLTARIVEGKNGNDFRLCGGLFITQRDVREFQLAKAAISAGIEILKKELGIDNKDISEVLLAGAFGNFIRRSNARLVGLIPDIPLERVRCIGNAALEGAKIALLSQDLERQAEGISLKSEHVELSTRTDFQQEFADALIFPKGSFD